MKDEIKEILDYLKALASGKWIMLNLSNEEYKMLYDYITNLQEKYKGAILIGKELNKENKRLKEEYVLLQNASEEYEDELQNKIDKATKYLEYQISQLDFEKDTKAKMLGSMALVLLQGSDE